MFSRVVIALVAAFILSTSVSGFERYNPAKNYCGPGADVTIEVPRYPAGIDFSPSCYLHDKCYSTCCLARDKCDNNFHENLMAACRAEKSGAELLSCLSTADTYYAAVDTLGDVLSYGCTAADRSRMECVCPRGNEWEFDDAPRQYSPDIVVSNANATGFLLIKPQGPIKLDLMIVLDDSGSMGDQMRIRNLVNSTNETHNTLVFLKNGTGLGYLVMNNMTKLNAAKISAKSIVNSMLDDERAGLVSFSTEATLEAGLGSSKADTLAAIDRLQKRKNTAVGEGISLATDQFGTDRENVMILLSDGYNNAGSLKPLDAARMARYSRVKVCTVAFGNAYNERLLRQIACDTGCGFYKAQDVDGLILAFTDIHAKAKGYTEKRLEGGGVITVDGQVIVYDVAVGGNDSEVIFMMQQEQFSNLDVELTDPDGKKVTLRYPGATYSSPENHPEYYIISDPKPGTWKMAVVGEDVPYEIPFVVYAAAKLKEPTVMEKGLLFAGLGLTAIIAVVAAILLVVLVVAVWIIIRRKRRIKPSP
ncbi:MAG: phospholipase A2 [Candidatus Altiarchaeota archaeon]